MDAGASTQLRVVCGLLASAARFVPVPLLDDLLREKALQILVSRALKASGRTYGSAAVAPLYAGGGSGCLEGCLLFVLLLPLKLILYPVRKIMVWVSAAKNLSADLSEAILLGRALDRCLARGRLAEGTPSPELRVEAQRIRAAFANALRGSDLRLLRGVLTATVRSVSGLPRAALHALRGLRKRSEGADPTEGLSSADREKVNEGAERIESALETPEMQAFLAEFDRTFDENLAILDAR